MNTRIKNVRIFCWRSFVKKITEKLSIKLGLLVLILFPLGVNAMRWQNPIDTRSLDKYKVPACIAVGGIATGFAAKYYFEKFKYQKKHRKSVKLESDLGRKLDSFYEAKEKMPRGDELQDVLTTLTSRGNQLSIKIKNHNSKVGAFTESLRDSLYKITSEGISLSISKEEKDTYGEVLRPIFFSESSESKGCFEDGVNVVFSYIEIDLYSKQKSFLKMIENLNKKDNPINSLLILSQDYSHDSASTVTSGQYIVKFPDEKSVSFHFHSIFSRSVCKEKAENVFEVFEYPEFKVKGFSLFLEWYLLKEKIELYKRDMAYSNALNVLKEFKKTNAGHIASCHAIKEMSCFSALAEWFKDPFIYEAKIVLEKSVLLVRLSEILNDEQR